MAEPHPPPRPQGHGATVNLLSSPATRTTASGTETAATTAVTAKTPTKGKRKAASELVEPIKTTARKIAHTTTAREHRTSDMDEVKQLKKRIALAEQKLKCETLDPAAVKKKRYDDYQSHLASLACHNEMIEHLHKHVRFTNKACAAERVTQEGELHQLEKYLEEYAAIHAAQAAYIDTLLASAATNRVEDASSPASRTAAHSHGTSTK